MIGVIANPSEHRTVREFFELFKTPWEFVRDNQSYDVVLCADDSALDQVAAKLLVVYSGRSTAFDEAQNSPVRPSQQGGQLSYKGNPVPIFGDSVTVRSNKPGYLTDSNSGEPAAYVDCTGSRVLARVGYDLFREIQTLLVRGQAAAHARIPTLDLHIAFLRELITGCGVPLVEIPPVPAGHPFIACLTHDVDFAAIRYYKFDPTMFGFLYRAIVGSAVDVGRGRLRLGKLLTNWAAAAKLPFVYLGLAKDSWFEFDNDYLAMEKGRPSTFFFIPFPGRPGRDTHGAAPSARAAGYDLAHVTEKIQRLSSAGCEIGLHGIDAWVDSSKGREEAQRILDFSGVSDLGVRMHWLYSDERSAAVLQEAEFSYDSTVGYNETVGYRAGTGQVFKPFQASRLLELPMHIMDTALFYPSYLNFTESEAWDFLAPLLTNAIRDGGVLTINWHDRSIAPERLWGDFYLRLLDELSARGAWFSTAAQAVSWFRKRRSAVFESVNSDGTMLSAKVTADAREDVPGLRLRFHPAHASDSMPIDSALQRNYVDTVFNGSIDVQIPN